LQYLWSGTLDIGEHLNHNSSSMLSHPEDRGLFFFQCALPACTL